MVQFTVQSHAVHIHSSHGRGKLHRFMSGLSNPLLSNVELYMSTAISPTLPDQCTLLHLAFVAHGSIWFGSGFTHCF